MYVSCVMEKVLDKVIIFENLEPYCIGKKIIKNISFQNQGLLYKH